MIITLMTKQEQRIIHWKFKEHGFLPPFFNWFPAVEPPSEDSKFPLAIHECNDYSSILNKDAIMFSDYGEKAMLEELDELETERKDSKYFITDEQQSQKEESQTPKTIKDVMGGQDGKIPPRLPRQQAPPSTLGNDNDDDESSILVQKLQDLVVKFEKEMDRYLTPDIPTGRKERKKYLLERDMFASVGYKEFVRAIELKVDAVVAFEDEFDITMFDAEIESTDENEEDTTEKFSDCIEEAIKGNFHSAIKVVNAVEQIVMSEEIGSPRRRLLTKIR